MPCREQLGNQNPQILFILFPCGYTISRLWGLFPTTAGLAFKVVLLLTPRSARRTHHDVQIEEDSTSADHRKAVSLWTPGEQRPHCHHHLNDSSLPPWKEVCGKNLATLGEVKTCVGNSWVTGRNTFNTCMTDDSLFLLENRYRC